MKKTFYITTPIYYASGKPHIGHSFTTLYADVLARYQKIKGKDVFFSTGMDEHGSKIAQVAKDNKKEPQDFVDEVSEDYKKLWEALGIKYSDFIRTTSEKHKKSVYSLMKKLKESGDIYSDYYEGLYCVGCESFILERNLVDDLCPDHLTKPQKVKEKNYFFNLKKYLPSLKKIIENNELKIVPESRKNEILNIIDSDIDNFSITREQVKWGIPFPLDKSQTIYVWVEALMNYLTILDFPDGENYKKFWPANIQIVGAEINKFHSIFWPAILLAIKLPLPEKIFVHGLFTVNGQKMSKTLKNVINPFSMIDKFGKGSIGRDATRYLLLSQFSAFEHGDIKESEFITKYNSDLANGVGNLAERVFSMINKFKKGTVKNGKDIDKKIQEFLEQTEKEYEKNMENLNLFEALQCVFLFMKSIDKYIDSKKPWEMHKNKDKELDVVLNSVFFAVEKIAQWLEPFMPSKIEELKKHILEIEKGKIKPDFKLNLFPRIDV